MIIIGLTGSIGMGKSTAAAMFAEMSVPVIDSDEIVHDLLGPNGTAVQEVAALFPDSYDRKNGAIDRQKLGGIVFSAPEKREELEAIIHPLVQQAQQKFIRDQARLGQKIVVIDIPLLFETGAETWLDYTICVTAPALVQRQRVLARDNMTEEKFERILDSQMPDVEKRKRADFVVQSGNGMAETRKELGKIIDSLKKSGNNYDKKEPRLN